MNEQLVEAEMSFLGSLILGGKKIAETYCALLNEDAFFVPAHKFLALAIRHIVDRGQEPDLVVLKHELSDRSDSQGKKWLELVGGEDYLIAVAEAVPSISNVESYSSIVKSRWIRRRMLAASRALAEAAKDPDCPVSEVVAKANELMAESSSLTPASVFAHISEIDVAESRDVGIPTGIQGLDSQISMGGYPAGQLSIVRAYHKGGKSTFLIQSALHAASTGHRVLYATFADLHRKHIKRRMMRMETGSMYPPDSPGLFDDWTKAHDSLNALPIDIYDVAEVDDGGTVEEFTAWAGSRMKTHGQWDVVFVDYAQELTSGNRRINSKLEEQMECARLLNRFASQKKVAVVVGSQITQDLGGGKRTKWGRDWEEKAGWVLTINPPQEYGGDQGIEISYSRFGFQHPNAVTVPVRFNTQLLSLEEVL